MLKNALILLATTLALLPVALEGANPYRSHYNSMADFQKSNRGLPGSAYTRGNYTYLRDTRGNSMGYYSRSATSSGEYYRYHPQNNR